MSGGAPSPNAAAFLGKWILMMVAMMLPSIVPTFWRYRRALIGRRESRATWLALAAGAGYFAVWFLIGLAVYPLDIALASAEQLLPALVRAVPVAAGVIVLIGGATQLSDWKTRQLGRCREVAELGCGVPMSASASWRRGLQLGWHCTLSCAGPMASLLVIGMMDLGAMAVVTAAVTAERLVPARASIARIVGVGGIAVGALLIGRAVSALVS